MKNIYTIIILTVLAILPPGLFAQPGITCNPNTFWAFNNGQIEEWLITGTTITSNGIVVTAPSPGISLAFCNNLGGGTFSPTFYTHSGSNAAYFDGTAWITDPAMSNCSLSNAAGAGNYLYYNYYGTIPACLDRFNGTSFVQAYSNSNLRFTIADLAVDDAGNAWCLMGANTPDTDSIMVISAAGQVISQFAFSMDTNNGYGCFLMNGILYVALGGANPVYPNTLLPISFTATAATAGTPINFTSGSNDLASCNAGTPLSINQYSQPVSELTIFPNIAFDYLNCELSVKVNTSIRFSISNTLGKLLYSETMQTENLKLETKIDVSRYSKGIYFVTVDSRKEKTVRKFVKE